MRNIAALIYPLLFAGVVGCASTNMSRYPNVVLDPEENVGEVFFAFDVGGGGDRVDECVRKLITNNDIDIRDSSRASWFAGTVIMLLIPDRKSTLSGGDVIIESGKGKTVAVGSFPYSVTAGIDEYLVYRLTIEHRGKPMAYRFSDIKRVFKDTGFGKNQGPIPLRTHFGARFEKIYPLIEAIPKEINECLSA
ncbi:hypothetical protein RPW65_03825 [Pseudomonas sp. NyZ704]|nr:hypothetical protein RPW65_03825 [Pseudomonas sp. NyZ704]